MGIMETQYLTAEQIAGILQVNKATVYKYIRSGALPAYKIGAVYRVTKGDLERFLDELRTTAAAPAA